MIYTIIYYFIVIPFWIFVIFGIFRIIYLQYKKQFINLRLKIMKIIGYKKLKEKVELELFRYKEEEILKINKEILKYQKEQQNEIEHTLKECFDKKLKLQIEIVKLEERQNLLNVNLTQKEKHYEQLIQLKNEEIIRLSELIKDINKNLVNVYCK